ncbi:MAG: ATP-binding cassette domain-containing protein, partial [Gemmatimonadetes bacterium]|nr:ATP-binding cassette domain-containing protein [Gemmatimonadota bacterium]
HVVIDGERRHVASYLEDFLFSSARARQPVSSLSGGERNRLLLARLFTRPANVLVLDEPTNDLDAETLELLESLLLEWDGTVLLVSHDRSFLDALCTSTLVFEGAGVVREHAGGYSDWKRVAERRAAAETSRTPTRKTPAERPRTTGARKLAYREQRELEELPARIETLERERADVHAALADPDLYREDPEGVRALTERLPVLDAEIETAYARWSELDAIATV